MRDYAKNQQRCLKKRSKPQGLRYRWWIIVALLVLLLGGAFVYSRSRVSQHLAKKAHAPISSDVKKHVVEQHKLAVEDAVNNLQYDFYRLLPAMKVPVSDQQVKKLQKHSRLKHYFVLQLAMLERVDAAKQVEHVLKAEGYKTFVQPYHGKNHSTWYRVSVGPFATRRIAQVQQKRLHKHQIEALLSEVQPDENQSLSMVY